MTTNNETSTELTEDHVADADNMVDEVRQPDPTDKSSSETTEEPDAEPEDTTEEPPETDKAIGKAKREAAKYRRQLRETEATVETLTAELSETRRQVAEQLVAGLTDRFAPNALWQVGVEVSDLLDDAGRVDPVKVQESVSEVREKLGLKDRRPPTLRPTENLRGGSDPTRQHNPQAAFTAAFGPR